MSTVCTAVYSEYRYVHVIVHFVNLSIHVSVVFRVCRNMLFLHTLYVYTPYIHTYIHNTPYIHTYIHNTQYIHTYIYCIRGMLYKSIHASVYFTVCAFSMSEFLVWDTVSLYGNFYNNL